MLLERSARSLGICVEQQQSLGQLSVVQSFWIEHRSSHLLVVARFHQLVHTFGIQALAGFVQGGEEREFVYVSKISTLEISLWHIVVAVAELEHILEHTAGCAAGRNEFGDVVPGSLVCIPCFNKSLTLYVGGSQDAVAHGCCPAQTQIGEALAELFKLAFSLLFADALASQLFSVF